MAEIPKDELINLGVILRTFAYRHDYHLMCVMLAKDGNDYNSVGSIPSGQKVEFLKHILNIVESVDPKDTFEIPTLNS